MATAAENEARSPEQIVVLPDMLIVGIRVGFITMVMVLEEALNGEAHGSFESTVHWMMSPFDKYELEKTAILLPTLVPFTDHW